jgi:cytoskeletal protein CcmA (bactofilin family)
MKWSLSVKCLICVVVFSMPVHALTLRTGESVHVAADEVIDDDIILFAQNIEIDGSVIGNVYAFGQTVRITGDVGGSVYTGGASVTVDTRALETIWAGGGSIEVLGNVNRNAILAGGQVHIGGNAHIAKDLGAYGGRLSVEGSVDGTLRGNVDKLMLSGKSGRVKIKAEEVTVKSSAEIPGDFIVTSINEPVVEEGAIIGGEQQLLKPEEKEGGAFLASLAPTLAFLFAMIKILILVAKIIVGILLIALFRRFVRRIMDTLISRTWLSLGWGFLGVIAFPVAVVILFFILIGYPIGVLGAYLYSILWYLSSIFVALVIGEKIVQLFKKNGEISLYLSFIIGILILFVVGFIPILNVLVKIFTLLFGFGALMLGTWYLVKDMREKELV